MWDKKKQKAGGESKKNRKGNTAMGEGGGQRRDKERIKRRDNGGMGRNEWTQNRSDSN